MTKTLFYRITSIKLGARNHFSRRNMEPKVVLVLDANQRSALAATRAIGCHTQYTVITADASNKALAGHSKYSSDYITYPDPAVSIEPFIAWLVQAIKKFNIDFLMPVTEITSRTILENKHALPNCHLPFAQYKTVLNISNKSALTKRAAALGVPTPFSEHFTSTADVDLSSVIYPVVVKPSLSRIKVDDQWLNTTVTVARNEAELRQIFLEHDYLERQSFMLQEFIDVPIFLDNDVNTFTLTEKWFGEIPSGPKVESLKPMPVISSTKTAIRAFPVLLYS